MLEQDHLWFLRRPNLEEHTLLRIRPGGPPLGVARWRPRPWLLGADVLRVCEYDDRPLVFEVCRMWTLIRRHQLVDADARPVGSIGHDALLTATGIPFVWRIVEDRAIRYHRIGGPLLASETREAGGIGLEFVPGVETVNPFLRMLILGAVLIG